MILMMFTFLAEQNPDGSGGGSQGGLINFENLCKAFPPGSFVCGSDVTVGVLVSKGLNYAFYLAGLILLFTIITSGFQMMVGASNPKSQEEAGKKLTNGVLGFVIVFTSYWIVAIIKKVLGM